LELTVQILFETHMQYLHNVQQPNQTEDFYAKLRILQDLRLKQEYYNNLIPKICKRAMELLKEKPYPVSISVDLMFLTATEAPDSEEITALLQKWWETGKNHRFLDYYIWKILTKSPQQLDNTRIYNFIKSTFSIVADTTKQSILETLYLKFETEIQRLNSIQLSEAKPENTALFELLISEINWVLKSLIFLLTADKTTRPPMLTDAQKLLADVAKKIAAESKLKTAKGSDEFSQLAKKFEDSLN